MERACAISCDTGLEITTGGLSAGSIGSSASLSLGTRCCPSAGDPKEVAVARVEKENRPDGAGKGQVGMDVPENVISDGFLIERVVHIPAERDMLSLASDAISVERCRLLAWDNGGLPGRFLARSAWSMVNTMLEKLAMFVEGDKTH